MIRADRPVTSPWTARMVYAALMSYAEKLHDRQTIADVEAVYDITNAIAALKYDGQRRRAAMQWIEQVPLRELASRWGLEFHSAEEMQSRLLKKIRLFLMQGVE